MSSVRDELVTLLTPLLPTTWRLVPNQRMPETIAATTVVIKHLRLEPLAEAPIGSLKNFVTITVADPHTDEVKAENALDDAVLELITALDGHEKIRWTRAEKVSVKDPYIGWDISVEIVTEKES